MGAFGASFDLRNNASAEGHEHCVEVDVASAALDVTAYSYAVIRSFEDGRTTRSERRTDVYDVNRLHGMPFFHTLDPMVGNAGDLAWYDERFVLRPLEERRQDCESIDPLHVLSGVTVRVTVIRTDGTITGERDVAARLVEKRRLLSDDLDYWAPVIEEFLARGDTQGLIARLEGARADESVDGEHIRLVLWSEVQTSQYWHDFYHPAFLSPEMTHLAPLLPDRTEVFAAFVVNLRRYADQLYRELRRYAPAGPSTH